MSLVSKCVWYLSVSLALVVLLAFPFSANAQNGITTLPDLNGDGMSDILWSNPANGQTDAWLMNGTSVVSTSTLLGDPGWKVSKSADFNGDGSTDLIVYNESTHQTAAWIMNGTTVIGWNVLLTDPDWKVTATADLNGDGKTDLLLYNTSSGRTAAWLMDGYTATFGKVLMSDPEWQLTAMADLNGDRTADLIWTNASTGETAAWLMNGTKVIASTILLTASNWKLIAAADLNGDQMADLIWYDASIGRTAAWLMNGYTAVVGKVLLTDPDWKVAATADLNGDGKADLVFTNRMTGQKSAWLMNGTRVSGSASLLTSVDWNLAAAADLNNDDKADLLWYNSSTGQTAAWLMTGTRPTSGANLFTHPNWRLRCIKGTSVTTEIACDDSVVPAATGTVPANQAPIVNAGTDQSITLPSVVNLIGDASDDDVPIALRISEWSQVGGPTNAVTFGDASSLTTTATFLSAGTYTLRLTLSDGLLSASDDVVFVVNAAAPANLAPVVNAGPDLTVTLPNGITLGASATDDGLPSGSSLSVSWSKVSGPGTVILVNANSLNASATFSMAGTYTLRLTVSDGSLSSSDEMVVTAGAQPACGISVSGTVTLSAIATDNVGVVDVQLKLDGVNLGAELTSAPYSIQWDTRTASNGCRTLTAVGRDAAGNQGSTLLQVNISNSP
jgi:hypothetical protein